MISPADLFFCFGQPRKNFRSHSTNSLKLAWAHSTFGFCYIPNLLGLKVNNYLEFGQPSFVRGHIAGQSKTEHQMLDHPECL